MTNCFYPPFLRSLALGSCVLNLLSTAIKNKNAWSYIRLLVSRETVREYSEKLFLFFLFLFLYCYFCFCLFVCFFFFSLDALRRTRVSISQVTSGENHSQNREWRKTKSPSLGACNYPVIHVTAFSQTDLFLVWIYYELRPPQDPKWPITSTELIVNWRHVFTGRVGQHVHPRPPFFFLPMRTHVDRKSN